MERTGRWWRRATFDFRLEACRLAEAGHTSEAVASSIGMPSGNLHTWLRQKAEGLFDHDEGPVDPSHEQLEINRLG